MGRLRRIFLSYGGIRVFLRWLNEAQRRAFLQIAARFIHADGIFNLDEVQVYGMYNEEMGMNLAPETMDGDVDLHSVLPLFDSRKSRAVLLLELIKLGLSDADYCVEESDFVRGIARAFGTGPEDLAAMESWVKRRLGLYAELKAFLAAE